MANDPVEHLFNLETARDAADGKLRVIGVSTFAQALRVIRGLRPAVSPN